MSAGRQRRCPARQWWKIGPRRENAKYAFSVIRSVIREVYATRVGVHGLRRKQTDLAPRDGFAGSVAPEMQHYVNTSVKHLHKRGEASPIKFVNC
jgi:uncharacterized protein